MKKYAYITRALFALMALTLFACSDDEFGLSGSEMSVTFRPEIEQRLNTRAIGDASGIDCLTVAVYERKDGGNPTEIFRETETWQTVQQEGVKLSLLGGHTYTVLFWAQNSGCGSYTLSDNGTVSVNYEDYKDGGFSKMEKLDAFCASQTVTVGTTNNEVSVNLIRPLAQLNFADDATQPKSDAHRAVICFHSIPTSLNLFTGEVTTTNMDNGGLKFTFDDFPSEMLNANGKEYYYVACNYLLTPSEGTLPVSATYTLESKENGVALITHEFTGEKVILLERNKKTNVLGSIVQKPEAWSVWDGSTPSTSPLTVDEQNRYIIDEANDLAWLNVRENVSTLEPNRTFVLTTDVDMNNHLLNPIYLPKGSTIEGSSHIIKNLNLTGGLFGDATELTVKDLNVESASVTANSTDVTHVGVLVNTLMGSSTFSGITIKDSKSITDNGASGGVVGYIVRKDKNSRTENLNVTFDNCHIEATTTTGTVSEGHFVGLLSGYDEGEVLTFNNNCSLTPLGGTLKSYYTDNNKSAWQKTTDFSNFNGWLGNEVYHRGTVNYGSKRFMPKWDGTTKVEPLTDGSTKLICSAFDLASLQGSNGASITFKQNVDLGKHLFTPIQTLANLNGENHTLYNLKIEMVHDDGYSGAAFIRQGGGTYKNFVFDGADITNRHNPEWGDGHSLAGNAYAATLIATVESQLTCENITCRNGKLYAVNKMGGLIGRTMYGKLNVKNCKVENYYIENYKPGLKDDGGFVTHGEVGGLIGFIYASDNDVIENCSVTNTKIKAYKYAGVGALLPGRHVNQFIGDIRTPRAECRVYLTNNSVSNNSYLQDKDEYNYGNLFNKKICPIVGLAYYVWTSEEKGQVIWNGTTIFS